MFKKIDHIEVVTNRPDDTVAFYTGVLEFREKARMRLEKSSMGVALDLIYLELGDTMVELLCFEGAEARPRPKPEHVGYRMMALEVENMEETVAYLKRKGVAITWGPMARDAYVRAEIVDPNGIPIELRQWLAKL